MARKPRVHYPGALYHVMVRGNNGEKVFNTELQKMKYIQKMSKYKTQFGFKLFAYCIMDNHAHLLIQVQDTPLSEIMQRIQQVYTQWYNRRHGRTGHVFQQRYKALLCDKENYLLQLIKYIHFNPLEGNMPQGIDYKWSSHNDYIEIVGDGLIDRDEVLGIFSKNKRQAVKQYLRFMKQDPEKNILRDSQWSEPKESALSHIAKEKPSAQININELMERVCSQEDVMLNQLVRKTRIQKISDMRKAIVLLSERYCNVTNTMLAQELNISLSMISKIKSGVSKGTRYVQEIIQRFEEGNK